MQCVLGFILIIDLTRLTSCYFCKLDPKKKWILSQLSYVSVQKGRLLHGCLEKIILQTLKEQLQNI